MTIGNSPIFTVTGGDIVSIDSVDGGIANNAWVPEPATTALLLSGLLGLALRRR